MHDSFEQPSPAPPQPAAKRLMVCDMELGGEVADVFVLSVAQQGQSRNGPYWRLEFRDASGAIGGKIWSPQSQAYPDLSAGLPVQVKARVTSYRDKLELAVESLRVLDDAEFAALDLALFMAASPFAPDAMLEELLALCRKEFTHKPWRRFITSLLTDEDIAARLRMAPAAKAMHHAYAGGLLEHTLSVARLCLRIADHYTHLDRQVLLAGAICHDLGKLWELTCGLTVDYTRAGRLIGHISLVREHLAPFLKKSGLEPDLVEHLQHLILSHHGRHEFGSPCLPAPAEALVLHHVDDLDAKLQQVAAALAGVEENAWSAYNIGLERFLFRAVPTPPPGTAAGKVAGTAAGTAGETARGMAAPARGKTNADALQQHLPLISQCSLLSKE